MQLTRTITGIVGAALLLTSCITLPLLSEEYVPVAKHFASTLCDIQATAADLESIDEEKIARIQERFFGEKENNDGIPTDEAAMDGFMDQLAEDPIQFGLFVKEIFDQSATICQLDYAELEKTMNALEQHSQAINE